MSGSIWLGGRAHLRRRFPAPGATTDARAETYLHYIVYCVFILCIVSPGRLITKVGRDVMDREVVVMFLIIFRTYFIVRRALTHTRRVRGLDHYATRTAQRFSRAVSLFELY